MIWACFAAGAGPGHLAVIKLTMKSSVLLVVCTHLTTLESNVTIANL